MTKRTMHKTGHRREHVEPLHAAAVQPVPPRSIGSSKRVGPCQPTRRSLSSRGKTSGIGGSALSRSNKRGAQTTQKNSVVEQGGGGV